MRNIWLSRVVIVENNLKVNSMLKYENKDYIIVKIDNHVVNSAYFTNVQYVTLKEV